MTLRPTAGYPQHLDAPTQVLRADPSGDVRVWPRPVGCGKPPLRRKRFWIQNGPEMSYYRQGPSRPPGPTFGVGVPGLTPMVKRIMLLCTGVWLFQLVAALGFEIDVSRLLGVVPIDVVGGMVWQPVTYMFLHSARDPFHLLFNMLMLWMFGGELERLWGGAAFVRYYVICGIGGGLGAVLLGLWAGGIHAAQPTVGASGAIFGVLVAYGLVLADRPILFMLIFPMKARTMVWIMVGLNFFYLLTQAQAGGNVSYIAHLAGGLTGFLFLKRIWRFGELYRELRWRVRRRRFKMVPPRDPDDGWLH